MSSRLPLAALCAVALIVFASRILSCESCRCNLANPETGGLSAITAGGGGIRRLLDDLKDQNATQHTPVSPGEQIAESSADRAMQPSVSEPHESSAAAGYRWLFTFSAEYRSWRPVDTNRAFFINNLPNGHTHGYLNDEFYTARIGYTVTDDLSVGASQLYRHLALKNVEDPDHLGRHETSSGVGDLDLDASYRFLHQNACFPVDVAVFADVKPPTGMHNERNQSHDLFDSEDQSGTGSWDYGGGFSASKRWGEWGASSSISYARHNTGSQHFKNPDAIRGTLGMGRTLPWAPCGWKLIGNFGLQDIGEFDGKDHGAPDRNHGGNTLFVLPGIAARPSERLIFSVSAAIPVYQDLVGFHQKQNFTLNAGVGVRF